jgi:hypothetical protein
MHRLETLSKFGVGSPSLAGPHTSKITRKYAYTRVIYIIYASYILAQYNPTHAPIMLQPTHLLQQHDQAPPTPLHTQSWLCMSAYSCWSWLWHSWDCDAVVCSWQAGVHLANDGIARCHHLLGMQCTLCRLWSRTGRSFWVAHRADRARRCSGSDVCGAVAPTYVRTAKPNNSISWLF